MGLLISRFRRKKTPTEVLETLETKIRSIEERGLWTEQRHKRIVGYMMLYSAAIFVIMAVSFYFVYRRKTSSWFESLFYASPLFALPIAVLLICRMISWYYNRKLQGDRVKLVEMRKEKRKLLEDVMNTETYKVAKEILDKYGEPNGDAKPLTSFVPTTNVPGTPSGTQNSLVPFSSPKSPITATPGQLRQRQLMTSTPKPESGALGNALSPTPVVSRLPRPILEPNRSVVDKVMDFLVGDGPGNRFALICSNCHSHNGMAVQEEFEYIAYRCAYCRHLNPARRSKLQPPPLQFGTLNKTQSEPQPALKGGDGSKSGSDAEKNSGSDTEDEKAKNDNVKSDEEKKKD